MKLIIRRTLSMVIIISVVYTIIQVWIDTEISNMGKCLYFLGAIAIILWTWADLWKDQINKQTELADKICRDTQNIIDEMKKDNGRLKCVYALLETKNAKTEQEACEMLKIDYDEFLMWKEDMDSEDE